MVAKVTRIPEKHYTVCTPVYMHYYGYDEPPEPGADCVTVIASNKRQAKVMAVRALRKESSDWIDDIGTPFKGLEVFEAGCPHGNCWCDLCAALPNWTECAGCMRQWEDECEHEWHTGPIQRSNEPSKEETFCFNCLLSKEEYESRISEQSNR